MAPVKQFRRFCQINSASVRSVERFGAGTGLSPRRHRPDPLQWVEGTDERSHTSVLSTLEKKEVNPEGIPYFSPGFPNPGSTASPLDFNPE